MATLIHSHGPVNCLRLPRENFFLIFLSAELLICIEDRVAQE